MVAPAESSATVSTTKLPVKAPLQMPNLGESPVEEEIKSKSRSTPREPTPKKETAIPSKRDDEMLVIEEENQINNVSLNKSKKSKILL